jgi:uncharacterized protein (TIGR03067 family)
LSATAAAGLAFAVGSGGGAPAVIATQVMRVATMKVVGVGTVIVLVLLGLSGGILWVLVGQERVVDDRQLIQGKWKFNVVRSGGQNMPGMFGPTADLDGRSFRTQFDATYTLDPSTTPKSIDLEVPFGPDGKPVVLKGVYDLTEDHLRIHLAQPGSSRPRIVQPVLGEEYLLLILERARE